MSTHPDDRPDPLEQPIRARVPDHVSGGCFSTGVIVMTAQSEFVLDFVQNLGRPHQIVARVVLPHSVLPQLVDALGRNIQLYRGRWGELPQPRMMMGSTQIVSPGYPAAGEPIPPAPQGAAPMEPDASSLPDGQKKESDRSDSETSSPNETGGPAASESSGPGAARPSDVPSSEADRPPETRSETPPEYPSDAQVPPLQSLPPNQPQPIHSPLPGSNQGVRQATAQEIYDDLKIRDELLSGVYANAVMIGHGPHEFSFDFITNFYPHSAVSARVFLAAGQVPRLYESLKGTWDQLRMRMQPPPPGSPPAT
jgi:hypothetical protein